VRNGLGDRHVLLVDFPPPTQRIWNRKGGTSSWFGRRFYGLLGLLATSCDAPSPDSTLGRRQKLAWMPYQKKVIAWLVTFAVLGAAGTLFPFGVFIGAIVTVGLLYVLVIPAPTILLYSISILPALMAGRWLSRPWRYAAALASAMLVAFLPGQLSRMKAETSWRKFSHDDFTGKAPERPRTIEIIGDGKFTVCTELCLRLLFNREVEQIRLTMTMADRPHYAGPYSVAYRIEKRDACPSADSIVDKTIRDHIIAGECLISTVRTYEPSDATIAFTQPSPGLRQLSITQQRPDGTVAQLSQQTESQARVVMQPFFFGYQFPHIESGRDYAGVTIQLQSYPINPIDMVQTMRSIFGFKVAPVDPMPPEDGKEVAKRILALAPDTSPTFSEHQLSLLNDVLVALIAQARLGDTDIELVGRIIQDTRINPDEINRGRSVIQTLFEKHAAQLAVVIPLVLSRLKLSKVSGFSNFHGALDRIFTSYPAEILQQYATLILDLVETRAGGPTDVLLSRVAEIDGNVSGIIAKYLNGESGGKQRAASIAICRATPANWITLKPIAVAHLNDAVRRGMPVIGENRELLLALARFGKKDVALKAIESAKKNDPDPIPHPQSDREKDDLDREIKSLKRDFPPDRCLAYR
jgi:hypothetical protein